MKSRLPNRTAIDREVEQTLHVLDDLEPARMDALFAMRLQRALRQRKEPKYVAEPVMMRFVVAFLLVFVVNVASLASYWLNTHVAVATPGSRTESIRTESLRTVAAAYTLGEDS